MKRTVTLIDLDTGEFRLTIRRRSSQSSAVAVPRAVKPIELGPALIRIGIWAAAVFILLFMPSLRLIVVYELDPLFSLAAMFIALLLMFAPVPHYNARIDAGLDQKHQQRLREIDAKYS